MRQCTGGGYRFVGPIRGQGSRVRDRVDKPSIAVLPFVNLSGDPEQEYFSDGLTEDLITDLSKLSDLFVIARNSVFFYKGKAVKVEDISKELGVQYVLEGSVRKADDRVRITAQLVDAITGHHLWAERYDRKLKDIFALQDEIVQKIVTTLKLQLTLWEQGIPVRKRTDNLEAYDYLLRGWEYHFRFTKEASAQARQMYEKAIELDPKYAAAYANLGWTYLEEWTYQWSQDPQALERAFELVAVLVGVPAEDFGVAESSLDLLSPAIPAGLPSALLERRPDVVEAERLMVAANARIGVAQAAFFPRIVLTGAAGFESADIGKLFMWPSLTWAAGPSISLPVFEGGRLTANLQAAQAQYEQTVATYRQQVLVAFQEVEDALAGLRVLAEQAQAQARAVAAARQTAALATIQYREGLVSYINVVNAEQAALDTEQAAIQILGQRVNSSVLLVKALGGGWNTGAASASGTSVP